VAREGLVAVQTPQGFAQPLLRAALAAAEAAAAACGDDAAAVQRFAGAPVHLVPGDPSNFKLTTDFDLALARRLLRAARLGR
jgi:2-C-methyl-D-erythritol 4-phosphate cytidylyltransferase